MMKDRPPHDVDEILRELDEFERKMAALGFKPDRGIEKELDDEEDELERELSEFDRKLAPYTRNGVIPASTDDIEMMRRLADINMKLAVKSANQASARTAAKLAGTATAEDDELYTKNIDNFLRHAEAVCLSIAAKARMRVDPRLEKRPAEPPVFKQRKEAARRKRQFPQEIRARTVAAEVIAAEMVAAQGPIRRFDIADELDTWFIGASLNTEFLDWPVGEIVAKICHDFNLSPDWQRWKDQPWVADAIAATERNRKR
jgi:hypothetical protein